MQLARTVIKHYFGTKAVKLEHHPAGKTNFVFEAVISGRQYIIRISKKATRITDFTKEQWIVAKVKEHGIPVPEILEVGNTAIHLPYMIQAKLEGMNALTAQNTERVLNQMGKYTALVNTIKTVGYGKTFDWSENKLSKNATWKEYLANELKLPHRLEVLEKNNMISKEVSRQLQRMLAGAEKKPIQTVLNHGDMRRKNIIVDEKGDILAIIDWEESTSNLAPAYDLAIALHDLSVDQKEYFLKGYGISPADFAEQAMLMKAFNMMHYAPVVESLVEKKAHQVLEQYRLRMQGYLDLYSL